MAFGCEFHERCVLYRAVALGFALGELLGVLSGWYLFVLTTLTLGAFWLHRQLLEYDLRRVNEELAYLDISDRRLALFMFEALGEGVAFGPHIRAVWGLQGLGLCAGMLGQTIIRLLCVLGGRPDETTWACVVMQLLVAAGWWMVASWMRKRLWSVGEALMGELP
jgi:hypothetical protein